MEKCFGIRCYGNDDPVTNYSSEAADACDITPDGFELNMTACSYAGETVNLVLCAAGFIAPWTWEIIGSLPDGISSHFNFPSASQMLLSGVVAGSGDHFFSVRVSDGEGNVFTKKINFKVLDVHTPLGLLSCGWVFETTATVPPSGATVYWTCPNGSQIALNIPSPCSSAQFVQLLNQAAKACGGGGGGGGGTAYYNGEWRIPYTCPNNPDGSRVSGGYYTYPAGLVWASTKAQAEAIAQRNANSEKNNLIVCVSCIFNQDDQNKCLSAVDGNHLTTYHLAIKAKGKILASESPWSDLWEIEGDLPEGMTADTGFKDAGDHTLHITGIPTISEEDSPKDYPFTLVITAQTPNKYFGREYRFDFKLTAYRREVDYGNVTPSIFDDTVSYWNNGDDLPAGKYKVTWVEGCMRYGPTGLWGVNAQNILNPNDPHKFQVSRELDSDVPLDKCPHCDYATQADAEAAEGTWETTFDFVGGKMGCYLFDDPYRDNAAGDITPTFNLTLL